MRRVTKKKRFKAMDAVVEATMCQKFQDDLVAHKLIQSARHSKIKLYETTGILCFAALVNVAVFNHNYAASLCLIPDVYAMYKLFKMI